MKRTTTSTASWPWSATLTPGVARSLVPLRADLNFKPGWTSAEQCTDGRLTARNATVRNQHSSGFAKLTPSHLPKADDAGFVLVAFLGREAAVVALLGQLVHPGLKSGSARSEKSDAATSAQGADRGPRGGRRWWCVYVVSITGS